MKRKTAIEKEITREECIRILDKLEGWCDRRIKEYREDKKIENELKNIVI